MKKGFVSMEMLMWILRIIVLTILIFAIGLMIRRYIIVKVDVSNAENLLLVSYLQKTPILYYSDEITGLVSRGIIDLEKFSDVSAGQKLENSISYGENQRQISANISLFDSSGNFINDVIYNKKLYSDLKVLSEAGGIWEKDTRSYFYKQPIVIKQASQLKNGNVIIEVLKQ